MYKNNLEKVYDIAEKLKWNKKDIFLIKSGLGNTNSSVLCEYLDKKYIFRIGTAIFTSLSINRLNEYNTISKIKDTKFNISVIYFDIATGDMVSEYIKGQEITKEIYNSDKFLQDISEAISTFKNIKADYYFNPYSDIQNRINYLKITGNYFKEIDSLYSRYRLILEKYEYENGEFLGFCHNDLYLMNIKYNAQGTLKLFDYEFAAMGDVFFDLACIVGQQIPIWEDNRLNTFIKNVFGYSNTHLVERLKDFVVIQLFWNYTWALTKATESQEAKIKFSKIIVDYKDKLELFQQRSDKFLKYSLFN